MTTINGTREFVRVAPSTDGLDILRPLPALNKNIDELLAFAHELRAQGLDLGPRIDKIEELWEAAQSALQFDLTSSVAAIDIDTVKAEDIHGIVTQAATTYTSHLRTELFDVAQDSGAAQVLAEFNRALFKVAGETLRSNADDLVKSMRKDFDKAAKAIALAQKHDVSKATHSEDLLLTGTDEQIAAYRGLPEAVQTLDRIARLRLELVRHLAYEPQMGADVHDVACFITNVTDELHLAGAELAWEGEHEHVQIDGLMNGSSIVKTKQPRLGGAWLQLLHAGHTLHLNTAAEAGQVALADTVKVS